MLLKLLTNESTVLFVRMVGWKSEDLAFSIQRKKTKKVRDAGKRGVAVSLYRTSQIFLPEK